MATITGYTAAKMKSIADAAIKAVAVVGDHLIITHEDDSTTDAGNVRGPQGIPGITDMDLYDPVGVPKPRLIPGLPAGHGWCDGTTEYDAVDAPILVAAWGSGPTCVNKVCAVGKFAFPDLRGKTIFGLHPGVTAFDTLLETGGSKDAVVVSHTHTADQPPHGHGGSVANDGVDHYHGTGNAGAHTHGIDGDTGDRIAFTHSSAHATATTGTYGDAQEIAYGHLDGVGDHNHGNTGWSTAYIHSHGLTIDPADPAITISTDGVSGTDKNLPPYRVANWIMRLA